MKDQLVRLIDQRASDWEKAKNHLADAEARSKVEGYESGPDQEVFTRITSDLDAADKRIAEITKIIEGDKAADEARALAEDLGRRVTTPAEQDKPAVRSDDQILREMRSGSGNGVEFERRDMTVGTTTAGGHTVPTGFGGRLFEHLIENAAIRQTRATVINTAEGNLINWPKTTAHQSGAALVAENGTIPEGDPAFGVMPLNSYKYGVLIDLSYELLRDTAIDLVGYLSRRGGEALGNATGAAMITADGSAKPQGIVPVSTLGKTAAGAAAIAAAELIDLQYSVIPPYRANGEWMMKDSTIALLRKIVDADSQFIWQPGLQPGAPNMLLGNPVHADPNMPAATTGLKSVLFGDFSKYIIRDTGGVRVERSDELKFASDQVTYRILVSTDGDLSDTTGAVKHLIQA